MLRRNFLIAAPLTVPALGLSATEAAPAMPATITILHCNDVYEIAAKQGQGGFAEFMTLLDAERARNPNCITTFGGDLLSPSVLSGLTRGSQMIELTNSIGVQIAVLGNHEFDFGPAVAAERIKQSHYPWLGSNVHGTDGTPAVGTTDLHLIEVAGHRIGFFGILTPETATLSSPGKDIRFSAPTATAEAAARRLREMGADLVVALTHLHLAEDRALAAALPGIDLVLGGHDHDPIAIFEDDTLIAKAGSDLHYLTAIDLVPEHVTVKGEAVVVWTPSWRYLTTAGVVPDVEIAAIVARWEATLDEELTLPVGSTKVELDTRRGTVRTGESNFGALLADALRGATGADVALTNGGGIRGDRTYPAGTVLTRKDILTELPFGNVTVLAEVTGAELLAALENGVSQVQDGAGRFPQVAGMSFVYDPTRQAGSRIVEVTVGTAPLDPARAYTLATNDYLLGGGDGYASLERARPIIDASAGTLMASTLINYITALGGEVAPSGAGRIARRN